MDLGKYKIKNYLLDDSAISLKSTFLYSNLIVSNNLLEKESLQSLWKDSVNFSGG